MSCTVFIHEPGLPVTVHDTLDVLATVSPSASLWIDIESRTPEPLMRTASALGLHELTVEDCLSPGHFPKFEDYGSYLFMILRGLKSWSELEETWSSLEQQNEPTPEPEGSAEEDSNRFTRKLAVFLSERFLVTFRRSEVSWLDAFVRQSSQAPDRTLGGGTDVLAYRVVDILIDRFLRNATFFEEIIERFERTMITTPDQLDMTDVLTLKSELTAVRHIARDQRTVMSRLATDPSLLIKKNQRRYFKDVDDHALDIISVMDRQIDSLLSLRDVYFATTNQRLGDTMRVLAVITTIAAPLNIVVGIYGMNFDAMPLLHDRFGFWLTIAFMLLLTASMLMLFRRKKWL